MMGVTDITFLWEAPAGTPADLGSVPVFSDDVNSPTYGIKRQDNNVSVYPAGTLMIRSGTGIYTFSFTDPAPNLMYVYSISYVYNGSTRYVTGIKTGTTTDASVTTNPYLSIDEFYNRYDMRLINQLSQDDDTGTVNYFNIAVGIDDAASEFDAAIAGRFVLTAAQGIPNVVKRWIAVKAIEHTFGRRLGLPAYITAALDWADQWIDDVIMGKIMIPTYTTTSLPTLAASESFKGRSRGDEPLYLDRPPGGHSTSGQNPC